MGWANEFGDIDGPAVLLYIGSILWVIGYDTIYAHQDKEDDAIVGVRSTARLFGDNTKSWLAALYGGALMCFAVAFAAAQTPVVALAGLIAAGAHLARQIMVLDIDNPDQCLKLFKSNNQVGWLIFIGLIGGGVWVALKPLV
jgi:4-hydroxybenzoate polyprenyltransferase